MQEFDLGAADRSPSIVTAPTHPFASFGKRAFLVVWALSFLALGLRLYRLSDQAFWIDEIYSIVTARTPWSEIYSTSTQVSNSLPTYFVLLRAILPEGNTDIEWAARLPSALAGAFSVPVFIGLVYCWRRNTRVALLAGLLLAINPLHIWYSQEVRAYALVLLFGLLAMLFLELALFSNRSEWLTLYLFSVFPALALHRSALIFPALCLVWHVLFLSRQTKPLVEKLKQLLIHLPIGIGVLLLMFVKLHPPPDGYRRAGSILQFGYTFMTFLGGYSFGPSLSEIQTNGPMAAVTRNWLQVGLLLAALALIVAACKLNWRKLVFSKEVALLTTGMGIVIAYSMLSGFAFNIRYVLPSLFGFLALLATLVSILPDRPRFVRLTIVAVLGISLWADAQWFYNSRYRKPDARAVAKWLVDNRKEVKSWTVFPGYLYPPLYWYLSAFPQEVLQQTPTNLVTTSFPPAPDVLLIQRRDQLHQPDQLIDSYRDAAGNINTNRSFTGFELYFSDPPHSAKH